MANTKNKTENEITVVKDRLTTYRRDTVDNLESYLKEIENLVFTEEYVRIPEDLKREIASISERREISKTEAAARLMSSGIKYREMMKDKKDGKGKDKDDEDGDESYDDLGL